MPKKFGVNTKSQEARERKERQQQAQIEADRQKAEDEQWRDDGTRVMQKKAQRAAEKEAKKQQDLQKKKEKQELLKKEEAQLSKSKGNKTHKPKLTQAQIEAATVARAQLEQEENETQQLAAQRLVEAPEITPNVNQEMAELKRAEREEFGDNVVDASNIDEALAGLSTSTKQPDRFPTKRMKAAYMAYQEKQLPLLKQENPTLKRSQLLEILWKQWQKAPENPLNQVAEADDDN